MTAIRSSLLAAALAPGLALALPASSGAKQASNPPRSPIVARPAAEANRPAPAAPEANRAAPKPKAPVVPPGRPARTVEPPRLTSRHLDAMIAEFVKERQAPVSARTNDAEFARRASLDLSGTVPTAQQIQALYNSSRVDKRARFVDEQLDRPEFARNWARYWREVVEHRATNPSNAEIRYEVLEDWLASRIEADRPWDEIATALIAGTGPNDAEGAVNFALAHAANPVEVAGEVSRIFLGVQIQCAECHDHPTDPWTRRQFHEFAAFFAGARRKRVTEQGVNPQVYEVVAEGRPTYRMPDLADPKKTIPIEPRYFLAGSAEEPPKGLTAERRRALVASYVTGQDNPWFARAFVNRVWYELMGEAFYLPIDDLGPDRDPFAPRILDALASQWQKGGYDVKWLFRTIMGTEAYQRQARSTRSIVARTPFASNYASRLRADPIADALAHAIGLPLAAGTDGPNRDRRRFVELFGVDPSTPDEEDLGTIPQALYLMNDAKLNRAVRATKDSPLGTILDANPKNNRAAIDLLYVHVFARKPYPAEVDLCNKYLAAVKNRREAFEDILWALVNSAEFISRR